MCLLSRVSLIQTIRNVGYHRYYYVGLITLNAGGCWDVNAQAGVFASEDPAATYRWDGSSTKHYHQEGTLSANERCLIAGYAAMFGDGRPSNSTGEGMFACNTYIYATQQYGNTGSHNDYHQEQMYLQDRYVGLFCGGAGYTGWSDTALGEFSSNAYGFYRADNTGSLN